MGISGPISFGAGISQPRCCALKYEFFVLKAPLQGKVKPLTQVMGGKLGLKGDLRITQQSWPLLSLQPGSLSMGCGEGKGACLRFVQLGPGYREAAGAGNWGVISHLGQPERPTAAFSCLFMGLCWN